MAGAALTPQGYVATTVDEEVADQNAKVLANVNASLDLSPDKNIGQLIGIDAEKFTELCELGATVYNMLNPDAAEGVLLANVAAISGTRPQIATYSKVAANLVMSASTTVPAGSIASVAGQPANTWVLLADVVSTSAGTYPGTFRSSTPGPFVANAHTLTIIATPVIGWTSVDNPLAAIAGLSADTDMTLRQRREAELAQAGSGTPNAIRAAVLNVVGVIQAFVEVNNGITVNSLGVPPKAFQVVVWDGPGLDAANTDIANAIWTNEPSGILPYGTTAVQVIDSAGNPQTVSFSRAQQIRTYVTCTTTPGTLTTDQTTAVKNAIVSYATLAFGLGSGIIARAFSASPLEATSSYTPFVTDVPVFEFDITPSPTNTANLPGSPLKIYEVAFADILVNGV